MQKVIKRDVKANGLTVKNVPYDVDEEFGEVIPSYVAYRVSKLMDDMEEIGIMEMEYKEG